MPVSGASADRPRRGGRLISPYREMLACNLVIAFGLLAYKVLFTDPDLPYAQLLATYRFGFARRAFVGELMSFIFPQQVPVGTVFVLGGVSILVTLGAFVWAYRRLFGLTAETVPLLVLMLSSPFFFKNFVYAIGYFDVYGALVAIVALVVPLGLVGMPLLALLSIVLVLVHHIHVLLYVPTIWLVLGLRYAAAGRLGAREIAAALFCLAVIGGVFLATAFFGTPNVPPEVFVRAMAERATEPLSPVTPRLWYSTMREEIAYTWDVMPSNLLRLPIFAALIALHAPLIGHGVRVVRTLARPLDRALVLAGFAGVCLGYLIICATVFDYGRWFSDWAVCLMLILLATKLLPSHGAPPFTLERPRDRALGWILTLIPRVGITKPF